MYELRKASLAKGAWSMVPEGHTDTLPNLKIIEHTDDTHEWLDDVHDIKEGYQVCITALRDYLITSPVQKILRYDYNYVVFETCTSVYELRKYED